MSENSILYTDDDKGFKLLFKVLSLIILNIALCYVNL